MPLIDLLLNTNVYYSTIFMQRNALMTVMITVIVSLEVSVIAIVDGVAKTVA